MDGSVSPRLELTVIPGSDRFDSEDIRWVSHEEDLIAELSRTAGGVQRRSTVNPGDKGATESVILALGSAGAFGAAMECFRAWLARDRTRRVEIVWTVDDREEKVVLEGTVMDKASFSRLSEIACKRLVGEDDR